jgi:hypothetical protein
MANNKYPVPQVKLWFRSLEMAITLFRLYPVNFQEEHG